MKLSVAMCTYNGADFPRAQLQSIIAQSRPPDEIVVCDDGSTDETQTLLKQSAADTHVPVALQFNEKNLGSVKKFRKGHQPVHRRCHRTERSRRRLAQ